MDHLGSELSMKYHAKTTSEPINKNVVTKKRRGILSFEVLVIRFKQRGRSGMETTGDTNPPMSEEQGEVREQDDRNSTCGRWTNLAKKIKIALLSPQSSIKICNHSHRGSTHSKTSVWISWSRKRAMPRRTCESQRGKQKSENGIICDQSERGTHFSCRSEAGAFIHFGSNMSKAAAKGKKATTPRKPNVKKGSQKKSNPPILWFSGKVGGKKRTIGQKRQTQ